MQTIRYRFAPRGASELKRRCAATTTTNTIGSPPAGRVS